MFRSLLAGRTGRKVLVGLAALAVPITLVLVRVIPASAAPTRFEAESGTCAGTIDSNHLNFSGTGFCNTTNAVGSTLSLPVTAPSAGSYSLTVHFANGTTSDRPMDIAVNGTTLSAAHSFPVTANWDTWADSTLTATLRAGSNTVLFTSTTAGGGPNIDYVDVSALAGATRYEAENGTCQGTIDSNHLNFSGTGFCNTDNALGATMTWAVPSASAGNTPVTFRYSNGTTGSRPATISVNGTTVGTLTFPVTANWDTWADATITLPLVAGTNTIVAAATTAGGDPNLDYLSINGALDSSPPTVPGSPRATTPACDSQNRPVTDFSWNAATDNVGVAFYDVYHDGQLITSVGGSTLTAHIVLPQNVTWGLYVNARDAAGNVSQASSTVSVTGPICTTDTTPPTAPANLTGTVSGTTVTLSWTASTDNVGVTSYDVYRGGVLKATVSGQGGVPPTTYTDAGLTANTSYTYYVVAHDLAGNTSPHSNSVTVTTGTSCTNPVCTVTQLTTDDDIPWGLVTLPDGTIVYNRRDSHDIIHLNPATGAKTNLGTVPNVQSTDGEGGLLGLEINPVSFSTDHWFYIFHTSPTDNRIVRVKYDPTTDKIVTGTEQVLLSGILRNKYHNGGRLRFSPDGRYLFAGTGDAQNGDNAQNRNSLNGKVLRINPDGSIPPDNPFGNAVWSYGHRNVQGLAFDSQGRLWEQEFGNSIMDETNLITKGGNYGWPICEGTANGTGSCTQSGLIAPKHTYPVAEGSCSGIAIVRDVLYVACERGTRMYREVISGSSLTSVTQYFNGTYGRLRTVEPAPDGGIWLTTSSGDKDSTPHNSNDVVLHVALGS